MYVCMYECVCMYLTSRAVSPYRRTKIILGLMNVRSRFQSMPSDSDARSSSTYAVLAVNNEDDDGDDGGDGSGGENGGCISMVSPTTSQCCFSSERNKI